MSAEREEKRGDGAVLIGLRRAGKTTVGRAMAAALGKPFLDTDIVVASDTGRTPANWIRDSGVGSFREVEAAAVAAAAAVPGAVIATGGGAVLRAENVARLRLHGAVLYLRADPHVLAARAAADPDPESRPVLGGAAADEPFRLFVERDEIYFAASDYVIDASGSAERMIADCLAALARGA